MSTSPEVFKDREAPVAQLEELKRQFERGEIRSASSRRFMADGTWKDIALGDDAQDRERVMAQLKAMYSGAH
jgi:hypothetical protein